jgi:23S rRNA pseudouridine1911/1915/1917 synthase
MRELVPGGLDGERVDRVVALLTGVSRTEAAAMVAAGGVRVGSVTATKSSLRVAEGDTIEIDTTVIAPPAALQADPTVVVDVRYEDDDVIVVDKQPGLVVHPGSGNHEGTLVHGLLARYPELVGVGEADRPGIVHRLDKGTSGLLVVARTEAARVSLTAQLAERTVSRRYLTLVWGHIASPQGMIDAPVGRSNREPTRMAVSARGKEARTRYEVLTEYTDPVDVSTVRCRLETGRTHQIRVHLAAIGHPVVGDDRYRGRREPLLHVPRPFLHAEHLAFTHPTSGEVMTFDSALPADLEAIRDELA